MSNAQFKIVMHTKGGKLQKKYKRRSSAEKYYKRMVEDAQRSWDCGAKYYTEIELFRLQKVVSRWLEGTEKQFYGPEL